MFAGWPSPAGEQENALAFDRGRPARLLVVPALFGEANRLRRFTAETMRLLDQAGVDSFLPDLPGCNESLAPLEKQKLASWREAVSAASTHFGATHALGLRGGAMLVPPGLPAWLLAPLSGRSALRSLLRARVVSAREAGLSETVEGVLDAGKREGAVLAGYPLGAQMIAALAEADDTPGDDRVIVAQELGGSPLWLRAEPGHDRDQSARLARIVAEGIGA